MLLLLTAGKATASITTTTTNTTNLERQNEFHLEGHVEMVGGGCSDVEWTVDMEAYQWTVAVRGSPGADWVALGISENGGMKGADVMVVKRTINSNDDEEFEVEDMFSSDYERPKKDIMQNVDLLHAYTDEQGSI